MMIYKFPTFLILWFQSVMNTMSFIIWCHSQHHVNIVSEARYRVRLSTCWCRWFICRISQVLTCASPLIFILSCWKMWMWWCLYLDFDICRSYFSLVQDYQQMLPNGAVMQYANQPPFVQASAPLAPAQGTVTAFQCGGLSNFQPPLLGVLSSCHYDF